MTLPSQHTPGPDHAAPQPKGSLMERIRKFLVAALGVIAMVVTTGVLEEDVEIWLNAVLAIATAAGVYVVPNRPTAPVVPDQNLRA